MKKSYLNSERNFAVSLKPSMTIPLLLMVLFVCLFVNAGNAANISSRVSGNWSSASTWNGGVVPSSLDNVTINNTVNVDVNATVQSVNVIGTLIENDKIVFTIGSATAAGSFTVGGTFTMGGSGSTSNDHSTLIVYGNYINNGASDLWKSDVIITGNLDTTKSTSKLQNNGNVIVGGDILGTFDLTGGTGTGQIYAVNPIATVTISPSSIDNNVNVGLFPSYPTESQALIDLINSVIYSTCTFTVGDIASVSICSGSSAVFTATTSATSPGYQWQVKVGTSDWKTLSNDAIYSGVTTATLTVISSSSVNSNQYRAIITKGCSKTGNSGSLTVTSAINAPDVGAITQPTTCASPTGSVVLSGLPSGSWTINPGGVTGNTTSKTISGLAAGTYNFKVTNAAGCTSAASGSVIISPLVTNTWNGSQWSTLAVPTIDQNIIFNGNYTSNTDVSGCTCQVNSGVKVIISPSNTLTIYNQVAVLGTGTLTFDSSATVSASNPISKSGSLVQKNNTPPVANSGNIIYNRTVSAIHNTDYTYWSSPVSSEILSTFSPQSQNKFYSFDADLDAWTTELPSNSMVKGKGYSIYGPQNISNSTFYGSFTGTPNNGSVSITGVKINKSYLIGNPYPSAIDADLFISANTGVLDGSLYFWTHNTDPVKGQYSYDDYATYNLTGGTGTTKGAKGLASTSGNSNLFFNANIPNGYIAAGQGFFVGSNTNSITDTKIVFDNSMRVGNGVLGLNPQFFKTKGNPKAKNANAIEKSRVWLNLSNEQGVFKQTLIGYITGATNDYETTYDADSYDSLDGADFYSVNGDSNLVIQGRALPFDENDTIPLGFRSSSDGDYTVNIDQIDGVLTNQAVFIEDKLTNTVTDLKNGDYKFSTVAGTFNDRFVLKYTNTSKTLGVDATDKEDGILVLYSNNYKTLIIHNNVMDSTVNSVALYNITGQKISNWDVKDSEQTNIQIPIKSINSGIYIVKVNTTIGESSKKIIVN
ncbi:T9SS type A sorting domain-containing protein [Flavobacterium soyangense]|uniref:T9SS type A sorting domain-containing protein n=1 Tax=Flavobacterium soyangense TaxID=2023265 RepID=A0A930XZ68_9FLAO|nr:T9SS type A sorting domain-containing protein [Flavobacterium soyangense]MBF2707119.1 T9SS type A sorting domain-containing protein [Flavobacterium soyangense]